MKCNVDRIGHRCVGLSRRVLSLDYCNSDTSVQSLFNCTAKQPEVKSFKCNRRESRSLRRHFRRRELQCESKKSPKVI